MVLLSIPFNKLPCKSYRNGQMVQHFSSTISRTQFLWLNSPIYERIDSFGIQNRRWFKSCHDWKWPIWQHNVDGIGQKHERWSVKRNPDKLNHFQSCKFHILNLNVQNLLQIWRAICILLIYLTQPRDDHWTMLHNLFINRLLQPEADRAPVGK